MAHFGQIGSFRKYCLHPHNGLSSPPNSAECLMDAIDSIRRHLLTEGYVAHLCVSSVAIPVTQTKDELAYSYV